MSNGLVKKVAGKETIEHLKKDLQFYSTRDLSPNQVYLLISKTEEYQGIDEGVLLLTIEQTLGEDYVSKIRGKFASKQEDYSQQPESKPYEPIINSDNITYEQENIQNIPETILKPKKKRSKAGKIIGLIAFLTLASVGGYVGSKFYKDYRRNKNIEAVRKNKMANEKKEREWRERNENERIKRDIYLEPAVCEVCHGNKKETCLFCKGKKTIIIGEYIRERQVAVVCKACKGAGYISRVGSCYNCNGNGRVLETKSAIDNQRYISCDECLDSITKQPTGFRNCSNCKGTGTDGDQMATITCNGFGETKDTLKKWIKRK